MTSTIKQLFGNLFRTARDDKGLSRSRLAHQLGISPKTVQSWEIGRSFIEDLSLIPILDEVLDISVLQLTGDAISAFTKKRPTPKRKAGRPAIANGSHDALAAVPLVRTKAASKAPAKLKSKDIIQQVTIPAKWVPRGGTLVAYQANDNGMVPLIMRGSIVIVSRRPRKIEKLYGQVVAVMVRKNVRFRLIQKQNAKIAMAVPLAGGHGRFRIEISRQKEIILGQVVSVLSDLHSKRLTRSLVAR